MSDMKTARPRIPSPRTGAIVNQFDDAEGVSWIRCCDAFLSRKPKSRATLADNKERQVK